MAETVRWLTESNVQCAKAQALLNANVRKSRTKTIYMNASAIGGWKMTDFIADLLALMDLLRNFFGRDDE